MRGWAAATLVVGLVLAGALPGAAREDPARLVETELKAHSEPFPYRGEAAVPPGETTLAAVGVDWCADFLAYNHDDALGTGGEFTLTLRVDAAPRFASVIAEPSHQYTFVPFTEVNLMNQQQCEDVGWGLFLRLTIDEGAAINATGEVVITIEADAGAGNMRRPGPVSAVIEVRVAPPAGEGF